MKKWALRIGLLFAAVGAIFFLIDWVGGKHLVHGSKEPGQVEAARSTQTTATIPAATAPESLPSPEWQVVTAPAAGTTEYEARIRPGYTIFRNNTDGVRIRCKDLFGAIQDSCPNGGTAELYQSLDSSPKKLLIRFEPEHAARAQAEAADSE
ncbi:MAG TPA: hypothetical protein VHO23_01735 [Candidatus Paceibacterota bacterium]|nr:hypothetical protein [Candidatus Paceibacterota bacterium]